MVNCFGISNLTRKFTSDEYKKLPGWVQKKIYEARQNKQTSATGSRQLSAITADNLKLLSQGESWRQHNKIKVI